MSFAFKLGRAIGRTAAATVHYGEVAVESTGDAGRDLVRGAKSGYTDQRASLMTARAAALTKRAQELQARAEPVTTPAPAAAPSAIVIAA